MTEFRAFTMADIIPGGGDGLHIELQGLDAALKTLEATAGASEKIMLRTLYRIAALVHDVSQTYAPRSPTVGDIRKATGRRMKIRKDRGTSRPKPGGLERSIDMAVDSHDATIFVASNSEAGLYAFRIHEEKGETWQNRGIGTISKGPQADDEFIVRAIKDEQGNILKIIESGQDQALKG